MLNIMHNVHVYINREFIASAKIDVKNAYQNS